MPRPRDQRDPVDRYLHTLAATASIAAPFGAAVFVILTGAVRPHELLRTSTLVGGGRLTVAAGAVGDGPAAGRSVPLPRVTSLVVAGDGVSDSLAVRLGVQAVAIPDFTDRLDAALGECGLPGGPVAPYTVWATAVQALTVSTATRHARAAVLAWAGIVAPGTAAARSRAAVSEADLRDVAALVDQLAESAGIVSASPVHSG